MTEFELDNCDFLTEKHIPFALVSITGTILHKGIADANRSLQLLLKNQDVHDFAAQEAGSENKKLIKSYILSFKEKEETETSVYKSKSRGDKRFWPGSIIEDYCEPNETFAIAAKDGCLYYLNISKLDLSFCTQTSMSNPIKDFILSYM